MKLYIATLLILIHAALADSPPARQINAYIYDNAGNPIGSTVDTGVRGLNVHPTALAPNACQETGGNLASIATSTSNVYTRLNDGSQKTQIVNSVGTEIGSSLLTTLTNAYNELVSIFGRQADGTQKSQRVDGSGNVAPAGDTAARSGYDRLTDGTNTAAVKPASTSASATDPAVVVSVSPNSPIPTGSNTIGAVLQAVANWTVNLTQIAGSALSLGQKTMANSIPVVLPSDQTLSITTGSSAGKTNVFLTSTLVTTATTADQVVLTYTVTVGKTLYLENFSLQGYVTSITTSSANLGTISVETPSGTKVWTQQMMNGSNGVGMTSGERYSEAVPIPSGTVIRVVVTPAAATSFTWRASLYGYEK